MGDIGYNDALYADGLIKLEIDGDVEAMNTSRAARAKIEQSNCFRRCWYCSDDVLIVDPDDLSMLYLANVAGGDTGATSLSFVGRHVIPHD